MNATTLGTTSASPANSALTFVGFATWLDEDSVTAAGDIELWRDSHGRLFAWSVNAHGESSVRLLNNQN